MAEATSPTLVLASNSIARVRRLPCTERFGITTDQEKVTRLVLLVLAVELLGRALILDYTRALDLLYLAGAFSSLARPSISAGPPVP